MRLFVLTHNRSKLQEIREILHEYGVEVQRLEGEKEEIQSDDVVEIALHAARKACAQANIPVAVDDTALYIEALNGFPGTYAEYVYRTIGLKGILKLLDGEKSRRALFITAVAYCDGIREKVFTGILEGRISESPRGDQGFGFDPIFIPEGDSRTLAEMGSKEKNRISHRAKAFRELAEWIAKANF